MPQRLEDLKKELAVRTGMRELLRRWAMIVDEEITAMEETIDRINIVTEHKRKD